MVSRRIIFDSKEEKSELVALPLLGLTVWYLGHIVFPYVRGSDVMDKDQPISNIIHSVNE